MSSRLRFVRTLLRVYLVCYSAAVAGATLTIWRSGLIEHMDRRFVLLALGGAILAGALLAIASRTPDEPTPDA